MSKKKSLDPNGADTGFSESWLALREPADHSARNNVLNDQLVEWFKQQNSHNILELGAGTGSNLRYLMPQLGHHQDWLLLDNDAALFARLPELLQAWSSDHNAQFSHAKDAWLIEHDAFSATIICQVIDLANELEHIPSKDIQLLTGSALLDLTSSQWLDKVATLVSARQCACLFALNYDGEIQWDPELEMDAKVRALLNEHQLNDKGFGKAMGPGAGHYLLKALQLLGRQVESGDSNWVIKPESDELQIAIIDGWKPAALEQDDGEADLILEWHIMRKQAIDQNMSTLTVGHIDVLSLP